jgi:hypothetical protein
MKLIRIGLFVIVAFAVLSHGAVEPWARGVLECLSGVLLILWALWFFYADDAAEIVLPQLLFPLAALALAVSIQWAFRLTASRFSTRTELLLLLSMMILLFLAAQASAPFPTGERSHGSP